MAQAAKMTPFAAGLDIRLVGAVPGRYTFPEAEEPAVYACRAVSLSPLSVVLNAPVRGGKRERVALRLEHVGLLNGSIAEVFKDGFRIDLMIDADEQVKLAAKINWLKKRSLKQAADKRASARFAPRNPRGYLHAAGAEHECFIIDLSGSGAALSARIVPEVGTAVIIGTVPAHVVRHIDGGFSVRFDTPREPAGIELEVTAERHP